MPFLFRCFFLALSIILALILLGKVSGNGWSYDEAELHKNESWWNKSYDYKIEYRKYAIHPLANSLLAALKREAKVNASYRIHEEWALPAFGSLRENILIAPNYDLATCQIEKVMTTIRDAIFCYLRDPIGFKAHDRRISSESWSESFCGFSNYRSNIDDVERQMGKKYKRFALIRNPFERFLSGYVDKCLKQCNFKKQLSTYDLIVYPESSNQELLIAEEFDRVLRKSGVPKRIRADIKREVINDKGYPERTQGGDAIDYEQQSSFRAIPCSKRENEDMTRAGGQRRP
ncbi:hypothetical protein RB195_016875 [Necator americanus]|uniref:Carbohydrate sulfotransferase n=1 Tax=Necator americanus TaxID=51031 RepID=A0ABR1C4T6_NECAM